MLDHVLALVDSDVATPGALSWIRPVVLSRDEGSGQGVTCSPHAEYTELDETLWRTLIGDRSVAGGILCHAEDVNYYKEALKCGQEAESSQRQSGSALVGLSLSSTSACSIRLVCD